jgi:hypothetical protein
MDVFNKGEKAADANEIKRMRAELAVWLGEGVSGELVVSLPLLLTGDTYVCVWEYGRG